MDQLGLNGCGRKQANRRSRAYWQKKPMNFNGYPPPMHRSDPDQIIGVLGLVLKIQTFPGQSLDEGHNRPIRVHSRSNRIRHATTGSRDNFCAPCGISKKMFKFGQRGNGYKLLKRMTTPVVILSCPPPFRGPRPPRVIYGGSYNIQGGWCRATPVT